MTIAAITMVRDDLFYIRKWIAHYGRQIGHENLYVLVHGNAPEIRALDGRVNYIHLPARQDDTIGKTRFNIDRFRLINNLANSLLAYFDHVIVTDADEYLVADPDLADSLPEYIARFAPHGTLTAFGLDVWQHMAEHPAPIDLDRPILAQRPLCKVAPLYHKPAITNRVIRRNLGNHASNDPKLTIPKGLYLFHLRYFDRDFVLGTQLNRERLRANQTNRLVDFPPDDGSDFTYRAVITESFDKVSRLPVTERFDFGPEIALCHKTWRRRRYLVQRDFWKRVLRGDVSGYSFHWRFDLIDQDHLHTVPRRFRALL